MGSSWPWTRAPEEQTGRSLIYYRASEDKIDGLQVSDRCVNALTPNTPPPLCQQPHTLRLFSFTHSVVNQQPGEDKTDKHETDIIFPSSFYFFLKGNFSDKTERRRRGGGRGGQIRNLSVKI